MKKIFVILTMLMFIFSCGSGSSKSSNFALNAGEEPSSIDPQISTDIVGGTVNELISEGLLARSKEGKPVAGIAEKWEISEDGLTWTFHIRENAKWENGEPITAEDFKVGWLRALNPETNSEYAYMVYPIKNAENYNTGKAKAEEVGIKVIDDKTIEVVLEAPTPYFDDLITFKTYMPFNTKFAKEFGEGYATDAGKILSSGPYILKEWVHNSEMKLEKNPNYWNAENVKVENITLKLIKGNTEALNAFKNGEVDVTHIATEQMKEFEGKPELVKNNDGSVWYVLPNIQNKYLKNAKIRKAILMAIDRDEMVKSILNGNGTAARTFVPANINIKGISKDFTEEVPTSIEKYDVAKAKELLSQGLAEIGETSISTLEILINDTGNNKPIAEYVQESLRKNLGIELSVVSLTFQERISRMSSKDFDLVLAGWSGDFHDAITYLDLFVTNGGNNHGAYSNPRYDELVRTVKSTGDPNVRIPAMIELEKIIAEDTPIAVLYHRERPYLVNKRVQGLEFTAIGGEFFFGNLSVK